MEINVCTRWTTRYCFEVFPLTVMQIFHILAWHPHFTKFVHIQINFIYAIVLSCQECIALKQGDAVKPPKPESLGLKNKKRVKYGFI